MEDRDKAITFGDVTVAEFGIEVGDNPACSSGCPVRVAWVDKEDAQMMTMDLDMYEYCKSSSSQPRRRRKALIMDVPTRAQMLLESGFSLEEIADATLKVEKIQKQRKESVAHNPPPGWETIGNILETTGKLPKGILTATGNVVSTTGGILLNSVKAVVKPRTIQARSA